MPCWQVHIRVLRAKRSSSGTVCGEIAGRIVGYGVVAVAITSSAVIGLAFSRYVESFSGLPEPLSLVLVLLALSVVAVAGVRESVAFAAIVTVLEAGTLLIVIVAGSPMVASVGGATASALAANRMGGVEWGFRRGLRGLLRLHRFRGHREHGGGDP